ncbi:hypothetical protein [Streptomyces diastatochromogenes]|nr:hypothetical protein [Streptomyces diastatochromogenes]MCZ0986595.1 hypothetical protein [Streptomyces diastatochromogenes]
MKKMREERRSKTWVAWASIGVLAAAGVVVWQVWPSEVTAVSVPSRVCEDSLSGVPVRALLPETGKPFSEGYSFGFNPSNTRELKRPGICNLSGGGKSVKIETEILRKSEYTMEDVARDASKSGSTSIVLGSTRGFHRGATASLFVNCTYHTGDETQLLSVDVTYEKTTERSDIKEMASLASDTIRLMAGKIWLCEEAADLPNGQPQVG